MPVTVVIGAQWGDEGKGKIVDLLAEKAGMVVRFSGGDNAGHTIVNQYGKFGLHLVPSGIFYPSVTCIIGNGVAVNPGVLFGELAKLRERGVATDHLFVSDRAHVIMPYHLLLDGLEEKWRGGDAIGTTRKGIGPVFADKTARLGIRVGDLLDRESFLARLRPILAYKNALLTRVYDVPPLSLDEVYAEYCGYGECLKPMVRDTTVMLAEARDKGEAIMLEGAQGTLLDPDFGSYPFTTSSSPLAANAAIGAGLGPTGIGHVLGVFKAYCTRVGGGPMPTELNDATGDLIRESAHEYGTTTGRPRRCGWFDGVAARFSARINGLSSMALTRLDVLDTLPSLKLCVGYRAGERLISDFPASLGLLADCKPVYEELAGWQSPTSDIRDYDRLPKEARQYIARIEDLAGCPASIISVGARREETIHRTAVW